MLTYKETLRKISKQRNRIEKVNNFPNYAEANLHKLFYLRDKIRL